MLGRQKRGDGGVQQLSVTVLTMMIVVARVSHLFGGEGVVIVNPAERKKIGNN